MSTTFDDNERSISQNRPIELYTITTPTTTYRHTSYPVDVPYAGNIYTALTMSRGEQQISQDPTGRELLVYLPITHPLVQRFSANGIPEHSITVTLQRLQAVSAVATQYSSGFATGIKIQGHTATVRCPSIIDDALKIKLPIIRAQKICNHILFDKQCSPSPGVDGPPESGFSSVSTIVSQTIVPGFITLVVAGVSGHVDNFFSFGRMVHNATQQSVFILQQIFTAFILETPLVGVLPGDGVTFIGGCSHDIVTCHGKFSNAKNFGGMPQMNSAYAPYDAGSGLSTIQQP